MKKNALRAASTTMLMLMAAETAALCLLVAWLPAVLFLGHRRLRARDAGVTADLSPEIEAQKARSLVRAARRSAAERRLRVIGLSAQSGWALSVQRRFLTRTAEFSLVYRTTA